jgi:hypothetical protein
MSEELKESLHREFEAASPDEHERFLRFIGLNDEEIDLVRGKSI